MFIFHFPGAENELLSFFYQKSPYFPYMERYGLFKSYSSDYFYIYLKDSFSVLCSVTFFEAKYILPFLPVVPKVVGRFSGTIW